MNSGNAVGAILRAITDHTVARPYGDGLLVDLPRKYGDGDTVHVLVEPMGSGYRVSDRGAATTLEAPVRLTSCHHPRPRGPCDAAGRAR